MPLMVMVALSGVDMVLVRVVLVLAILALVRSLLR